MVAARHPVAPGKKGKKKIPVLPVLGADNPKPMSANYLRHFLRQIAVFFGGFACQTGITNMEDSLRRDGRVFAIDGSPTT